MSKKIFEKFLWLSLSTLPITNLLAKEETLGTVDVIDNIEAAESIQNHRVGETIRTSKMLSKQQVSDSRDLVRYETGITAVETGRMGSSGYAVRGVDENRVGVMIDGLRQAETLSSQGFKELFEGYGNYNNTRNSAEIENIQTATIVKGSDSARSGGGALGGSVLFKTKDARDYLLDKDYHVGIKQGYQSADRQNITSATLAGRYKDFDAMLIHTRRSGHERENYFYDIYKTAEEDRYTVGKTREKADPYTIKRKSTLLKVAYQPNDEHRFSAMLDDSTIQSNGMDLSYTLNIKGEETKYGARLTDDHSKRKNIALTYENFSETPLWDAFKVSYSSQKITNNARTDEYCSGSQCINIKNPDHLTMDSSTGVHKIVDRYGKDIKGGPDGDYGIDQEYTDSKGNSISVYPNSTYKMFLDCSKLDCNKKVRIFNRNTNLFEDRNVTKKTIGKVEYGEIEQKGMYENTVLLLPNSRGYNLDLYSDRDLNSDTKQLDFDFEKGLTYNGNDHQLKFGGTYSEIEKSMVNKDGYIGKEIQWWVKNFICGEIPDDGISATIQVRPENLAGKDCYTPKDNTKGRNSYLIPVKSKNSAIYFGDNFKINDWLSLDLNYRYDSVKHKPHYNKAVPVPKGLVTGLFKKIECNNFDQKNYYNSPCYNKNFNDNLKVMLKNTSYKHHSYNLGVNIDPTDWLKVQLKYSNGFRAPTSDEVYMTFKHPSFSIGPNPYLKAEVAKTKDINFTFYKNRSFLRLGAFQTDYDDFIDLAFKGNRAIELDNPNTYPFYGNINRDSAKVTGFEVNTQVQLGDFLPKLEGFRLGYKFMHQKGRMDDKKLGRVAMNAIQPDTSVYSLGYSHPDDKYGIDVFIRNIAAKNADDTYNMYWAEQKKNGAMVKGQRVSDEHVGWRSGNYTIVDAIAYAKPIKNLTLTAGVYNLTDKKYITWDSARSIRAFGTINQIDQNTGKGIKRFYAPGRNFRITGEYKF